LDRGIKKIKNSRPQDPQGWEYVTMSIIELREREFDGMKNKQNHDILFK
jgi:hypothetical protein